MKTQFESPFDLEELLRWAERGRGWPSRNYPPQFKSLPGGCQLIVLVPTLWRGHPPQHYVRDQAQRIEFPRARRKVG